MTRLTTLRAVAVVVACVLFVAGCSIDTSTDQITGIDPVSTVVPAATSAAPTAVPQDEPTPEPDPTAAQVEPDPEDDTELEEEEPVDTSPVLVDGGEWAITQNEYDELVQFVADTHELAFSDPVGIVISDDIGQEFARGFEPFSEPEWFLMRGLGLASSEAERLEANQVRLDRIRGFCCTANSAGQAVVVELQDTEFATSAIVVHELVHALHVQNPELTPRRFDTDETPFPAAAAFEGVPQFITFEYLLTGSPADRAALDPDLPIIRDDMLNLIQAAAARHLNFAYDTGPSFVDGAVAELGIPGLSELMMSPPTTTEQVMFPEKYLAGEQAETVEQPDAPDGARIKASGTIGSAMLWFLLAEDQGTERARQMVEPWSGDTYLVYELDDSLCLRANVVMDTNGIAVSLASFLTDAITAANPNVEVQTTVFGGGLIELQACH